MPSLTSTLLMAVVMAPPHGAPPRFGQREAAVDLRSPTGVDAAAGELLQQQGHVKQRGRAEQTPAYGQPPYRDGQPPYRERGAGVSVGAPVAPSRGEGRPQGNTGGAVAAKRSDSLPPRSKNTEGKLQTPTPTRSSAFMTVAASLSVVLGLFFLVIWFARRSGRALHAQMPAEVLEVLGKSPLSARMQMHVVRFGNKLVLLAVSAEGAVSLAEITEPLEVDRLAGVCQANQNNSITESFRQVLGRMGEEPAPKGFLGAEAKTSTAPVATDIA